MPLAYLAQKIRRSKVFGINAFSIAEAMIVFLITSVLLALCAPLFTKRNVNLNECAVSNIPSGAIMYFDSDSCPTGWEKLTEKYPHASSSFIRNLGEIDRTFGSFQATAAPNITGKWHAPKMVEGTVDIVTEGALYNYDGSRNHTEKGFWGSEGFGIGLDASRISSAYQKDITEIRPQNIALLACRKI